MWALILWCGLVVPLAVAEENDPPPPTTLAEAHAQLARILPREELERIDAMKSEDEMVRYHMGLGMGLRNGWGLWKGGALASHLRELGFTHPDDMSATILETFWCRRHGQDFRLAERARYYAIYWKSAASPPKTARDPSDGSAIEWNYSFGFGDDRTPRQVHVGKSAKTGRLLVYEHDKGVHVPDKEVLAHIKELDKQNEKLLRGGFLPPEK